MSLQVTPFNLCEVDDTQSALSLFDQLQPVSVDFMLGTWRGEELATGHPMEGLLELVGWHGKRFESGEEVHPLVMRDPAGFYFLDPRWVPMGLLPKLPRWPVLNWALRMLKPLVRTRCSRARLRLLSFRGRVSATMCYDQKPIFDIFRKIDDQTVMGLMDMKGGPQPYFFVLRRG